MAKNPHYCLFIDGKSVDTSDHYEIGGCAYGAKKFSVRSRQSSLSNRSKKESPQRTTPRTDCRRAYLRGISTTRLWRFARSTRAR